VGWNSEATHVRVGQLFAAAQFLKMSVQVALKTGDLRAILGSCYPSQFAVLSGTFAARIGGDCAFRMIRLDG
jgi:hypothetical protein